jgi:HD-GYP domain-containing protein (c-di-GMP phosphodiesterase class II)
VRGTAQMLEHEDILKELNRGAPIAEKLASVHRALRERYAYIDRVAVALYDPKTDVLKTFVDSTEGGSPLVRYEARLASSESLQAILRSGRPRVVQDLSIFADVPAEHARRIGAHGYRASYTLPMYLDGAFFGFVFFNSLKEEPFTPEALHILDVFGHLVSLVIISEISHIQTLLGAIKSARSITHHRDYETGAHLDRMAHYAQLIARGLADKHQLSDEYIEHVFLFAPLHDVGKIAIPDRILLKAAMLDKQEREQMQKHTLKGRQIVDEMLADFGLGELPRLELLRNIVQSHHEAIDGSGYPQGLKGDAIPIEARIIAVADVFDALTSARPYKRAWSNEAAFEAMLRLADIKLDRDCVEAMVNQREKVEAIQTRFREEAYA